MARIRTIKPEFFASEDVSDLPIRARLTWIGLWTHCDDHGRTKDQVKLIKAAVWPLDDLALREVAEDLEMLAAKGRIVRYEVDGTRYLAVVNWHHHQSISRPSKPKYPPPSEPVGAPEPDEPGFCEYCYSGDNGGLHEDSLSLPGLFPEDSMNSPGGLTPGKEQGTGNREQGTPAQARKRAAEEFNHWYRAFPRHEARIEAENAYRAARKRGVPAEKLLAGAVRYAADQRNSEKRYTKLPATWLNKGCYDDYPETASGQRHLHAVDPRPVQAIPDNEIDVDGLLGPDHWSPPITAAVDDLPREERQAWIRAQRAKHAAERIQQARSVLASRRGSA